LLILFCDNTILLPLFCITSNSTTGQTMLVCDFSDIKQGLMICGNNTTMHSITMQTAQVPHTTCVKNRRYTIMFWKRFLQSHLPEAYVMVIQYLPVQLTACRDVYLLYKVQPSKCLHLQQSPSILHIFLQFSLLTKTHYKLLCFAPKHLSICILYKISRYF